MSNYFNVSTLFKILNTHHRYHSVVENSAEFIKIEGNKALEAINSTKKPATTSTAKSKVSVKPVVQVTDSIIKLEGEEFGSQFINLVKSIFRQSGSVLSRELVVKFLNLQKIQKECLFKDKDTASLNAELDKHTITLRPDLLILQEAPDLSLVNFRNVLIKLFDNVEKIKKKEVMEKWLEECGCVPNSGQYTKLMQEFAVTKSGGIWILKGLKD